MAEFAVTFLAGASHGLTSVLVGQPLDTIKTRMQAMPVEAQSNSLTVARHLFAKEGIRGLYRGGLPIFVGGSLMRSAQFGVSGTVKDMMQRSDFPQYKILGVFDYQVIVAGMAGGVGRGLVEVPADFLKIRRQVEQKWTMSHLMDGTFVTLARNTVLFAAFVVYMDLGKQTCQAGYVPNILMDQSCDNLSPFAKGECFGYFILALLPFILHLLFMQWICSLIVPT